MAHLDGSRGQEKDRHFAPLKVQWDLGLIPFEPIWKNQKAVLNSRKNPKPTWSPLVVGWCWPFRIPSFQLSTSGKERLEMPSGLILLGSPSRKTGVIRVDCHDPVGHLDLPTSLGSNVLTPLIRPHNWHDCGPTNPPRANGHVQKTLHPSTGGEGSGVHFLGTSLGV